MQYYTKWTIIYLVPAILLLFIPLFIQPSVIMFGLIMIPFFILNAYFSSKNRERAFINDISAICVFAIAGLASSYLPDAEINSLSIIVFLTSVLFFTGCTFFVKTMIREKKNPTYKWLSWGFHLAVPIIWILLGEWLIAIAFIPSLIRAFVFYGKGMAMKNLGILEIINSAFFFIIMVIVVV